VTTGRTFWKRFMRASKSGLRPEGRIKAGEYRRTPVRQ
jgi:hypothetical protein